MICFMVEHLPTVSTLLVVFSHICLTIGQQSFFRSCPVLQDFPQGLSLRTHSFHTFGHEVNIPHAYMASPRNSMDVVRVANWAYQNGYRVRGSGSQHTWSPLAFAPKDDGVSCPKVILLDTTKHLNSIEMNPPDFGNPNLHSVTVGSGVLLMRLLEFLEENGFGLYSTPFIPVPTIGGMLAVGAHGTGVGSALYDKMSPGHSSGTFSNLVIEMTIVAWNNATSSYELKTIHRSEEDCKAFLTNFGRTFVTSATLRVGANQNLRSQTHFFVTSSELFAHPEDVTDSTRSLSKFVETYGRVNFFAIPPSNKFWVHTIHNAPVKPPTSRLIRRPRYINYFNFIPLTKSVETLIHTAYSLVRRIPQLRQLFPVVPWIVNTVVSGQEYLTNTVDAWGLSKNHFMIIGSKVPHVTDNAFMVVTSRKNLQLVVHVMRKHFEGLWREFQGRNEIPAPGTTFLRITSLDNPDLIGIPGAEAPSFSSLRPIPEYPDFDTGIWMDTTGYINNPETNEFTFRLQTLLFRDLHGKHAIIRAEWSKGWAYTDDGAWRNSTILNHYARTFSSSDKLEEWNWGVRTLNSHDPHKVFSNSFLDEFLKER